MSYGILVLNQNGETVMTTDDPMLVVKHKGTIGLGTWTTGTTHMQTNSDDPEGNGWTNISGTWYLNNGFTPPGFVMADRLLVEVPPGHRAFWFRNGNLIRFHSTAPSLRYVLASWASDYAPRTSGYGAEVRRADGSVVWSDNLKVIADIRPLAAGSPGSPYPWVCLEEQLCARGVNEQAVVPGAVRDGSGVFARGLILGSNYYPSGGHWRFPGLRIKGFVANIDFDAI
ncbi:hypothetical protein [Falsigemmobacter faecalis]|uniref:Uncharacterized protein n=1 Tax=Falsigemmobacter faecalis TaxID=2488730 RepID=A0A3P3DA91_9RHOB|nr:hypothetical protein [Falsigemmobacter faecalis]RRH71270.1 hypothetical protein EG244_16470 [Falsigemmobacter faecalis]